MKNECAIGSQSCVQMAGNWIETSGRSGLFLRIRHHSHNIQQLQLDAAIKKNQKIVKELAAKEDITSARILAREIVKSNKQMSRLSTCNAHLESVKRQLDEKLGEAIPFFVQQDLIHNQNLSYDESDSNTTGVSAHNEANKPVHRNVKIHSNNARTQLRNEQGPISCISGHYHFNMLFRVESNKK